MIGIGQMEYHLFHLKWDIGAEIHIVLLYCHHLQCQLWHIWILCAEHQLAFEIMCRFLFGMWLCHHQHGSHLGLGLLCWCANLSYCTSYASSRTCTSCFFPFWLLHHWYFPQALDHLYYPPGHLDCQWPFFLYWVCCRAFGSAWCMCMGAISHSLSLAFLGDLVSVSEFLGFPLFWYTVNRDWLAFDCNSLYTVCITILWHVLQHFTQYRKLCRMLSVPVSSLSVAFWSILCVVPCLSLMGFSSDFVGLQIPLDLLCNQTQPWRHHSISS